MMLRLISVVLVLLLSTGGQAATVTEQVKKRLAMGDKPNRLIHEKSPYLLQHAFNPVDWYPWGDDAFARAKKKQADFSLCRIFHLSLVSRHGGGVF